MTDFLYARPSFLGGAARALDLGGTMVELNRSRSSEQANRIAIAMDWAMVGEALRAALAAYQDRPAALKETEAGGEADQAATAA